MSGSISPLALQMLQAQSQDQGQQQGAGGVPGAPGNPVAIPMSSGGVPLSSLMAPNANMLQAQNPSLPWYAVPGMFPNAAPPPPPPAPLAPTAPAASPSTGFGAINAGVSLPQLLTTLQSQLSQYPQYKGLSATNLTNLISGTPALQKQLNPDSGGNLPASSLVQPYNGTG